MLKKKASENIYESYKKKQVNLLPDLYFKRKRRVRMVIMISFVITLGISIFAFHLYELYNELDEVKAQNNVTKNSIQDKSEEQQRQALLKVLKNRIAFKADLVKEIEKENESVIFVTDVIESILPSGILYLNVTFDSTDSVTIFGRTYSEEELPDLLHSIRGLNVFHDVAITSIVRVESENYSGVETYFDFTLKCEFGGVNDEIN